MNGAYGGGGFDRFDAPRTFYNGNGGESLQEQQQTQRSYPCYDTYDPTQASAPNTAIASIQGMSAAPFPHQYNSAANQQPTHHAFMPSQTAAQRHLLMDPTTASMAATTSATTSQHHHHNCHAVPSRPQPPFAFVSDLHQFSADKQLSTTQHLIKPPTPAAQFPLFPDPTSSIPKQAEPARKENPDIWLESLQIKCPDVSVEPLTGTEVLKRVRSKTDDVVTRYLPCVEFLVSCQQELRQGLLAATQKRLVRHAIRDSMTPRQFYARYLEPLPDRFFQQNRTLMEMKLLQGAVNEVKKLCQTAKGAEYQGCEVMKNTFLGGMKDGESWGLRKWLSKHGGALHICNDLECILRSCQDLDRSLDTTNELSKRMRPMAKLALDRLQSDVPSSYQEVSSAHPYLPFFHRLESALKAVSNFDPDDDDVICIDDDDEIEEVKKKVVPKKPAKRKVDQSLEAPKRLKIEDPLFDLKPKLKFSGDNSDEDSIIEIVDVKPASAGKRQKRDMMTQFDPSINDSDWECPRCTMLNAHDSQQCCMCDKIRGSNDSDGEGGGPFDFPSLDDTVVFGVETGGTLTPPPRNMAPHLMVQQDTSDHSSAAEMAQSLDNLALQAHHGQHRGLRPKCITHETFWDVGPQFASALRLLAGLLRNQDAESFVEPVDQQQLAMMGRPSYSRIKHPLCFRDIVSALEGDGELDGSSRLNNWNMWRGMDLLQAIDLCFLNKLAYIGKEKSPERSTTNKLRRKFWDAISEIIAGHVPADNEKKREYTPTRRGESSGFVIQK